LPVKEKNSAWWVQRWPYCNILLDMAANHNAYLYAQPAQGLEYKRRRRRQRPEPVQRAQGRSLINCSRSYLRLMTL
jgi:hypothetical protein